jgi:hypothetical protein
MLELVYENVVDGPTQRLVFVTFPQREVLLDTVDFDGFQD